MGEILISVVCIAGYAVMGILLWKKDRQVDKAMEMLASRSFPEYVETKAKQEDPVLSSEERQRIAFEERIRDAEFDPYSRG